MKAWPVVGVWTESRIWCWTKRGRESEACVDFVSSDCADPRGELAGSSRKGFVGEGEAVVLSLVERGCCMRISGNNAYVLQSSTEFSRF